MTQAALDTLDRLDSALTHSRPKDVKRFLGELREELQKPQPAPATAPAAPPRAARPKDPSRPRPWLRLTTGDGIIIETPVPPRAGDEYRVFVGTNHTGNEFVLGLATSKAADVFKRLVDQFKDWTPEKW